MTWRWACLVEHVVESAAKQPLATSTFYLGRGGMGVVYLLFCRTFIPAIVALIETFILVGMSDAEFAQKFPG